MHCILLYALDTTRVMDELYLSVNMPPSETIDHIHIFQALVISFTLFLCTVKLFTLTYKSRQANHANAELSLRELSSLLSKVNQ